MNLGNNAAKRSAPNDQAQAELAAMLEGRPFCRLPREHVYNLIPNLMDALGLKEDDL